MTAWPAASMSSATSKVAKPSTRTGWRATMEMPLGYDGGVPDSAKTRSGSTDVGSDAWMLVGLPQAFRKTTTTIVASSARRAFILLSETDGRLEGLLHDNTP